MLKSKRTLIIAVIFFGISISLPDQSFGVNTTINSTIGDLDGDGDSVDEDAVIQAAADCWDARITTNRNFTLNITGGDLTGGTTGQGATSAIDGNNTPTAGNVTIDNSNRVWFIDLTPNDNSEFTPDPNSQWRFLNGPAGSELYTTVIHEIGHAQGWLCGAVCGFNNPDYETLYNPQPANFVSNANCRPPFPIAGQPPLAGCVHLTSPTYDVSLRGDGLGGSGSSVVNELSHPGVGGDLMEGFGASGQRETPSEDDVDMFGVAYGDTVNLPPTVDLGGNVTSECNAAGGSNASLDGTASTDPEGDALTHSWSCPGIALADANTATPSGFFPLSSTTTCRDDVTDLAQCSPNARTVDVTVVDTTDPGITCPDDITDECAAKGGTPDTDPQIAAFLGGAMSSDTCDSAPSITDNAPSFFNLGSTDVLFAATDDSGNSSSCTATVTIEDTTPPDIQCNAPATIVPSDAPISFTATTTDICDAGPSVVITAFDCFKFTKDGKRIDKTKSCQVSINGDSVTIDDSGGVNDTIEWTVEATDGSGNISTTTCSVLVVNPSS